MKILVTGSSGHLGEALVRTLRASEHQHVGLDVVASPYTDVVGSIANRDLVRRSMQDVDAVIHAATLHKPHVATHSRQDFVDTNVTGTLNLLEEAAACGVSSFVFTSTTSVFGRALVPPPGAPAAWITEDVKPVPKNIYGVTKVAAEDLCELFHRHYRLPCLILRVSRFFPESDDDAASRAEFSDDNLKAIEFLYRRVDIQDVVDAHLLAVARAGALGFGRYIISATTPLVREDLTELRQKATDVVRRRAPGYEEAFARMRWKMLSTLDRVYDNELARRELGWQPRYDFARVVRSLMTGEDPRSGLARAIGPKRYHDKRFVDGPHPVRPG